MNDFVLFGIIAVYLLVCVGFGFLRGMAKSRIRCLTVLGAALLSLIITVIFKNSMLDMEQLKETINSAGLPEDAMGTISALLLSETLCQALVGFASAFVVPILYVAVFAILCFISWIVHLIVTAILRKKLKAQNERAKHRTLWTVLLNVAQGLIVVFVVLAPFNVYSKLVEPVMTAVNETGIAEENPEFAAIMGDYAKPVSDSVVLSVYDTLGGGLVCDAITDFRVNDKSVHLDDEVEAIVSFVCNIMSLSETDIDDYTDKQAGVLNSIATSFEKSELLSTIMGEVVYYSTESWMADEDFVGIGRPNMGEMLDPMFVTLLEILHSDAKNIPALKADIQTTASLVGILAKYNAFANLDDTDAFVTKLGADGMVKELIATLGANQSMKVLIPEITNVGMRAIAKSLKLPANSEEVYNNFTSDIADALNETKHLEGEARVEALTDKVLAAFDTAGVPIEREILDAYSASLIADLGSAEEVTADDVSAFFTIYASTVASDSANSGTEPTSATVALNHGQEKKFNSQIYDLMTDEQLQKSGAAVLASVSEKLSRLEGTDTEIGEAAKQILIDGYDEFFDENNGVMKRLSKIKLDKAIDPSTIQNTAGMKDQHSMKTNIVTMDQLVINVKAAAALLSPELVGQEADILSAVFANVVPMLGGGIEADSIDELVRSLGPILDQLQASATVGAESTANLLIAAIQSEPFRKKADMDVTTATQIAKKATESKEGEPVKYENTLNAMAGAVVIGNSISSGDLATEDDIRKFIETLTPQTAAIMRDYLTPQRMLKYGIGADKADVSAELLENLFDYLAGDIEETKFDSEVKAVQQLLNIAIAAKNDTTGTNKLFGEHGRLKMDAYHLIEIMVKSDSVCYALDETLVTENGTESDPFGVGKQITEESTDRQEFLTVVDSYRTMHAGENVDERLILVGALFGIAVSF